MFVSCHFYAHFVLQTIFPERMSLYYVPKFGLNYFYIKKIFKISSQVMFVKVQNNSFFNHKKIHTPIKAIKTVSIKIRFCFPKPVTI